MPERSINTATGSDNTATGNQALGYNLSGSNNTASEVYALFSNTTGRNNTAVGTQASYSNTTGINNTAFGYQALVGNVTGSGNAAQGSYSLTHNTSGIRNIGIGNHALGNVTTGGYNIGIGYGAGQGLTIGSNNIEIATAGNATDGVAADSGVIRIGKEGTQSATYVAGIYANNSVGGLTVVVDSKGQLGAVSSSERFKTDIATMGSSTDKLQQLHPVTFHYKSDSEGTRRYGLIAEEVAQVYPELVVRDNGGRIDGVRYDELAPMLLNEMQQQRTRMTGKVEVLTATIAAQDQRAAAQGVEISQLRAQLEEMHATLATMQAKDQLVAQH